MGSVHVLVVAGLPVEFDAAREVMGGVWTKQDVGGVTPFLTGEYKTAGGGRLTCLAMSGVCAGNPDDTAAGDFDKDDRFKEFAARASAEVLFALLGELLDGTPPATAPAGYPGAVKVAFSQRLSHDWQDIADLVGIPSFDRPRFARGDEARAVWEWLEGRNRLGELPAALDEIGRTDLADLFRSSG